MGYDEILYFFYDPRDNIFCDQFGFIVLNIFEMITPNDLLLFKEDHGYCIFPHRHSNNILCEILINE
jgi:hypothetical protein